MKTVDKKWSVADAGKGYAELIIRDQDGNPLAAVTKKTGTLSGDEGYKNAMCNARLMAAAPLLLKAVKNECDNTCPHNYDADCKGCFNHDARGAVEGVAA